jgi:hypothetical protein
MPPFQLNRRIGRVQFALIGPTKGGSDDSIEACAHDRRVALSVDVTDPR